MATDKHDDALEQAGSLLSIHGSTLDWDYLWRRAEELGVADTLAQLLREPRQKTGKSRWEQAIESGKIEIVGPRKIRWRIDFKSRS